MTVVLFEVVVVLLCDGVRRTVSINLLQVANTVSFCFCGFVEGETALLAAEAKVCRKMTSPHLCKMTT